MTVADDSNAFNRGIARAIEEAVSRRRDRDTARAEGNWRRVAQALFALRHLQRIFKNVGDYLQELPQTLRSALSLHIGGNRRAGGGRHRAGSVQQ
jgi:hypothetical protein